MFVVILNVVFVSLNNRDVTVFISCVGRTLNILYGTKDFFSDGLAMFEEFFNLRI